MNRDGDAARKQSIRDQALSRLSERDRQTVAQFARDMAEMREMLARQEGRLDVLVQAVSRLEELLAVSETSAYKSQPRPLTAHKRQVLARIQSLRSEGLSFDRICQVFRAEQIPTLSGAGEWSKGTLWNLWKNHHHQLEESE